MFEDLVKRTKVDEKVLVSKSLLKALKDSNKTKQELIETLVTEVVALKLKRRELETILDSLNADSVVP